MPDRFPRTVDLPSQSPLFWVEQKDRYLRQLMIRDIEALTGRRLFVYFGNRLENAQIDARDPSFIYEMLGDLNGSPFDLLLEVTGGFTDSTEAIISLIKSLSADFRVVIANAAKSNGTMLALASSSIVMGPASELGPIEPSLGGIPCTILSDPKVADQNFVLHKQGIFALQQSKTLAETLLSNGMLKGRGVDVIKNVVDILSSRDKFASHGSVIDHHEAASLGLKVDYLADNDEIWKRIWLLYCMYEFDCRKARYLKVFEGNARSTAVAAPLVSLPAT